MGYITGMKKPMFAYYDAKPLYGRVAIHYPLSKERPGVDVHGQSIENYKIEDKLMMIGSLENGENKISQSVESAIIKIAGMIKNKQF
jgi:hypothetical protein